MTRLFFLAVAGLFLFAGCSKDKTITTPNNSGSPGGHDTVTQSFGKFVPTTGITVSGNAKIVSTISGYTVLLDSFMVSQGPDLKVYLSKQNIPAGFINLGALKTNTGNSDYAVPAGVDFSVYKYVLIHCQQYNHLFAIAQLKP